MTSTICYSGMGALESGNHTQKEFLDIMDKRYKRACPLYIKSLTCAPCKKLIKQVTDEVKKQIHYKKLNKTYKQSKKKDTAIQNLRLKCTQCKNKTRRKCKLSEYLAFSGAEEGKC
jgi:hypothetical protein